MEPDSITLEQAILGLAVMSAIPVVALWLWVDYFGRQIAKRVLEEPEFDRSSELEKVKMICLCALIFQILLFLGSSDLREAYPVASPLIFVIAVFFQIYLQTRAEILVQRKTEGKKPRNLENILGISLRAACCWVVGVTLHLFFLGLAATVAAVLIQKFQTPLVPGVLAFAVSGVFGLVLGIILNLAVSPIYFKFIFPMHKLEEGALRGKIEACFSKFGFEPPDLFVLDLCELRITQNILTGLRGRSGTLRPVLFLSNLILMTLSESELEVLILNQVSHFILKHPRKRGLLILALIATTTFLALISVLIGQGLAVEEPIVEIVGMVVSFLVFLGSFHVLFLQTQRHEAESDLFTVKNMGVSCEVLGNALRKLDILADPIPVDLASISRVPVGFPETERRIKQLEISTSKENLDKAA